MADLPPFAVTWDYRCPFARNAHEHLLDALAAGARWDVTFVPFFLNQTHVEDGAPSAFEDPAHLPDLLSLEAGVVVRDRYPDRFLDAHRSLFAARHDEGGDLRDREVVSTALERVGVPAADVLAEVDDGWPRATIRKEHEASVDELDVFGVPTFIVDDRAAFARLMERPGGNADLATQAIERIVTLMSGHPELNELKHTRIRR
ncbi:MAG: DsbA family protein [Acidimicrobiales bacterium]